MFPLTCERAVSLCSGLPGDGRVVSSLCLDLRESLETVECPSGVWDHHNCCTLTRSPTCAQISTFSGKTLINIFISRQLSWSPCPPLQTCFQSPFPPLLISFSLSHQFASQAGAPVYHSVVPFQSGFHQNVTHASLLLFSVLLFDGLARLSPPPLPISCACWMFLPDSVSHVFSGKETLSWKSGV